MYILIQYLSSKYEISSEFKLQMCIKNNCVSYIFLNIFQTLTIKMKILYMFYYKLFVCCKLS